MRSSSRGSTAVFSAVTLMGLLFVALGFVLLLAAYIPITEGLLTILVGAAILVFGGIQLGRFARRSFGKG